MRFKFPFPIRPVSEDTIEIDQYGIGQPVFSMTIHPTVEKLLPVETIEKVYNTALTEIIRQSITVVSDE